jgi:DNA-binding transcriptional ArsR family regulator
MNAARILQVGEEPPPLEPDPPRPKPGKASKTKGPARERFAVLNAFVDFTLADLTRAEIAVWMILYRDTRDGTARTSYDDLARRVGINRRNIGRALRRLERRGLVRVVYQGGLRRGPSRYRVRALAKDA